MDVYKIADQLEAASVEEALDRLALLARRRRLLFFFGAGVSRAFPSLNPLVDESSGLPGLRSLLIEIVVRGCPGYSHELVTASLAHDSLEATLGHLALVIGDRTFDFLDLLGTAPGGLAGGPNYHHYSLALLAQAGYCRTFFTVNFDTLFEEAFDAIGAGGLVVPEERGDEAKVYAAAVARRQASAAHLFKLHGTLRAKRNLLTTIEVVGLGLPRHKERLLRETLQAHACFFMGYRSGDRDIFPVLTALPRSCEVFWFDVGLGSQDLKRLAPFLRPRPHRVVLSATLSTVLQALLSRLDVDDRAALDLLGLSSLSELQAREEAAVPSKAQYLRAFAEEFRAGAVPPEAATLMMSLALALGPGGVEMRERLFASLEPGSLPTTLRYAYSAHFAERQWGASEFRKAIVTRGRALRELRESGLPPGGQIREAIEQHIRTGRDYLALGRVSPPHARGYRLLYDVSGITYFLLAAFRLLTRGHRLTGIERGRLWAMLVLRPASALHKGLEGQLVRELRRWTLRSGAESFPVQRSLTFRAYAAPAEWLYRRCLHSPASTFGWKSLAMRSLAEVVMHRTGTCPPEARRLVAGARIGEDESKELGTHEALLFLYSGAFDAAEQILDKTFLYYRDQSRQYLGGMAKTLLMQALGFALQGKQEAAAAALDRRDELLRAQGLRALFVVVI